MMDKIFHGLFDAESAAIIEVSDFLLCIGVSLVLGLVLALTCTWHSRSTRSFLMTLALLPAVVCVVIMMVNGNVGAGVAVAGAFSLVRFRSAAGSAREITLLFLAMGAGLITGMGYLGFAALFTAVMCLMTLLYTRLDFGTERNARIYKTLHITIPEDLDYDQVFEQIFKQYAVHWELVRVKTTNMGSLFRLTYNLTMKEPALEKEMIDKLRCRNGNLEISVSRQETTAAEL
ncbi:MAG: DUF4956 domain-containing protein [Clostridia bacterium]|nr:DUF4956 domain-containing protein [Clostridia bacterium]